MANELVQVVGYHAVEPYKLAMRVVQDLDLCRRSLEQHRCAAREGLDIAAVRPLVDQGKQVFSQACLATWPGE